MKCNDCVCLWVSLATYEFDKLDIHQIGKIKR